MRRPIGLLSLTLLAFATASDAGLGPTFDLTGTWTGKGSCSGLFNGDKVSSKTTVTLEITHDTGIDQVGADLELLGTGPVPFTVGFTGCGFADAEIDKPDRGRAAIHGFEEMDPFRIFGTGDLAKAMVFAADKKGRTGKITGSVMLAVKEADEAIVTCKLSVFRVSGADPAVDACPVG
jgi:hypothetical protein